MLEAILEATVSDGRIVARCYLTDWHIPTHSIVMRSSRGIDPKPSRIELLYFADDKINLLYFDDLGKEMNDTFHESIEDAKTCADEQFGVKFDEWTDVDEPWP